ncbi:hypothetical protein AD998_15015 [bacterium 336/3]|nr:hypothetical protein AD998_15015 [bacterium 336/3]
MNYIEILKRLLGDTIERLFLIMCSDGIEDIDVKLGLVMNKMPNQLIVIGTDLSDWESPAVTLEELPTRCLQEEDFYKNIEKRISIESDEEMWFSYEYEYYDFSNSNSFKDVITRKISNIQFFGWNRYEFSPFGIKLIFKSDFILSLSHTNGNTIETKNFNINRKFEIRQNFREIIYTNINSL